MKAVVQHALYNYAESSPQPRLGRGRRRSYCGLFKATCWNTTTSFLTKTQLALGASYKNVLLSCSPPAPRSDNVKLIHQIWRGCGTLPGVGEHPGAMWAVLLPVIGLFAGGLTGGLIMSAFTLPLFFYGAYTRAQLSDALTTRPKE